MPSEETKEVVAAALVTNGKVWLTHYDDQPDSPWQLINFRHDGHEPIKSITDYLARTYNIRTNDAQKLGTKIIRHADDNSPVMVVTGLYIPFSENETLESKDEITVKLVDQSELSNYEIPKIYQEFISQTFETYYEQ